MSVKENEEHTAHLLSRMDDLCGVSDRGEMGVSQFLSPRELHYAKKHLASNARSFVAFGGYDEAERQRIYVLPDYMEDVADLSAKDFSATLSDYGYATDIIPIKVVGSGYRELSHRDFLGALLGLGIERGVVGDIIVLSDDKGNKKDAVVFCDRVIAPFIERELTAVANDKVSAGAFLESVVLPKRETETVRDTVASSRLDAVVAALCNLSREKAREAVVSGLVELDYESEERPDRAVSVPSTISVRGYGKFCVRSLSERTKKGRYRLEAERYI